ncbi:type I polyketide synthase [Dactylosporangium sp. CA-139114]|uniref:type I polyketide synthase n=1 Tax=Dactylosporangium sp. CA-139114 TaxID=3239931 RepID=UPI003D993978
MSATEPVAVVGLACRFPGAADAGAFWRLLRDGRDAVTEVPADRWDTAAVPGRGGFLDDVAGFDAALLRISPREAAAMDPQQRVVLELVWAALEDAGIPADTVAGSDASVHVGVASGDYATLVHRRGPDAIGPHTFTGLQRGLVANQVSRCFGLTGPSLSVDTGQSSSLVAVHLAAEALRLGRGRIAIAGGVHLHLAAESFLEPARFGALSPSGACRVLDARADGYVPGEGGAIVVLKRHRDALADGDRVLCLIAGGAVNNAGDAGATGVPGAAGQSAVVRAALAASGVEPAAVQYVELHGTGTPLGDATEAAALGAVHAAPRHAAPAGTPRLRVGSVKTNIGHLGAAAGIAGLVKTVLGIAAGELPASLHFTAPPAGTSLDALGLQVQTRLEPWPAAGAPRIAGVSSFGVGGTHCHLVLREAGDPAPIRHEPPPAAPAAAATPWVLAARTPGALRRRAADLLAALSSDAAPPPCEAVAGALTDRHLTLEHRAVVVGRDRDALTGALAAVAAGEPHPAAVTGAAYGRARTVFVFPGQGGQWPGMARRLLAESAVFRAEVETCTEALRPHTGGAVREALLGAADLDRIDVVQPALFAVMAGLAALWRSCGVTPDAVVGHSQGEIAAAYVAGALTLDDAARVVAVRSRLLAGLDGTGGMLAAQLPSDRAQAMLGDDGPVSLAAVNGPEATVLAGPLPALEALRETLGRRGVRTRLLDVGYASHSAAVEPLRDSLVAALAGLRPRPPRIPLYSTVEGDGPDGPAFDGDYWYTNLRRPVRLDRAIRAAFAAGHDVAVEIGPHATLTGSLAELAEERPRPPAVLGTLHRDDGGLDRFLLSAASAYAAGVPVGWRAMVPRPGPGRPRLPGYPFERRRYWFDLAAPSPTGTAPATAAHRSLPELVVLVRRHVAALLGHATADGVDVHTPLRDLGMDSPRSVQLCRALSTELGVAVPAGTVLHAPTPQALAAFLHGLERPGPEPVPEAGPAAPGPERDDPVVVVAAACRLPGGVDSPEALWRMVDGGGAAEPAFPADRGWPLQRLVHPDPDRPGSTYATGGGFLADAAGFDAALFGISPREALAMDPQQRLLLELTWELFERAGIDPQSAAGPGTGVFVGAMPSGYGPPPDAVPPEVEGHLLTGTAPSVLTGRLAYQFGLGGPAVTVDTACSSSLVALHLAVRAVRGGECDRAIAGGVTVMATPMLFVEFSRQRALSPDGRCRSFSADADGTGWSEGAGLVLVERLSTARRHGHPVLAVVAGTAVNQDGASNGLTAPSGPAQERVIRAALADAGLGPGHVDAVEAHGTGTALGDPVEATAILATYGRDRAAPLWLGSLKSNLGHAQAAAGIAGVIKMLMAMRHGVLPATLHVDRPTPHVDWPAGAVQLLRESRAWPRGVQPRRAGVSSFGISGTNAHVILQEAPDDPAVPGREPAAGRSVWALSARTETALREQAARLRRHLDEHPGTAAADVGYSLGTGRAALQYRAVVDAGGLAALAEGRRDPSVLVGQARRGGLALLFSGQGSQRPGMGGQLAARYPAFARALADVTAHLGPVDGSLQHTDVAQPALFAFEVALFRLLEDLGVVPDALLGHSLGELAAAHIAQVLSLADACTLVKARGRLMERCRGTGAMLAVALDEPAAARWLAGRTALLAIAAVNGPAETVLSGTAEAIAAIEGELRADGHRVRRLPGEYGFHSAAMDPILDEFAQIAGALDYHPPVIPVISAVDGRLAGPDTLCSPAYWVAQARRTVRFREGIDALAALGVRHHLEIGPGRTLATLGRRCRADATFAAAVLPGRPEPDALADALAELYVAGADVRPYRATADASGRPVALPAYPFQHERFWLGRPAALYSSVLELPATGDTLLAGTVTVGPSGPELVADWVLQAAGRLGRPVVADFVPGEPVATGRLDLRVTADAGRRALTVHTRRCDDSGAWARNATATLGADAPHPDADPPASGGPEPVRDRLPEPAADRPDGSTWRSDLLGLLARRAAPAGAWGRLRDVRFAASAAGELLITLTPVGAAYRATVTDSGGAPVARLGHAEPAVALSRPVWRAVPAGTGPRRASEVVVLAPHRAEDADVGAAVLAVTTRLLAIGDAPLTVVTRGAVAVDAGETVADLAGAAAWGFVRAAQRESPGRLSIVDVDEPDHAAAVQLALGLDLPQLAVRRGTAFRPELEPMTRDGRPGDRRPWNPDGTVLITGGTGGLGRLLAVHLAEHHGVRHLVLLSRTAGRGAGDLLRRLADAGAHARLAAADVADREQLAAVLDGIPAVHPLTAVIHAAGTAADATLATATPQQLAAVLRPKVEGSLNLHRLTLGTDLAAFVLFSSAVGTLGGFGQAAYGAANAFLDALAQRRRARDLPAQSLAWGVWDIDAGMAAGLDPLARRRLAGIGVPSFSGATGLALFDLALRHGLPVSLPGVPATAPLLAPPPAPVAATAPLGPAPRGDEGSRRREVLEVVRTELAAVLGHASPDRIGPDDRIWGLGLDSLTSLQLAARVTERLGVRLPSTALFEYDTVEALAGALAEAG